MDEFSYPYKKYYSFESAVTAVDCCILDAVIAECSINAVELHLYCILTAFCSIKASTVMKVRCSHGHV